MSDEICFMTARELVQLIRRKELSACEVMQAHLNQIECVNPKVNAIVTMVGREQAMEQAKWADKAHQEMGLLHGLPVAHKDLHETKGMRTTYGSFIFKDFVPTYDSLVVERMKKAGAITIGKTNTPEFGAGSQTFNAVFGKTLNPYDTTKTCGGSSGGAAVALACGMIPLADGSDMGGSLRNPASYCNVVGLRPSPGRVPHWPARDGWSTLGVGGPMARTVGDVALLMSAIAGPDMRSPIALDEPGAFFARGLERDFKGVRIAWSADFGRLLPVDSHIIHVLRAHRHVFEDLGCIVEEAVPDFSDADEVFKVLRAWSFQMNLGGLLPQHREKMKDSVIWNIEEGEKLTAAQVGEAEIKRTLLYHRMRQFMQKYEFLLLPVTQVPPFDVHLPYVSEIEGIKLSTYIEWMKSCYYISVSGNPALSVPCGFTDAGLPVGLQIVGRHRDDWGVLQLGEAFEQATNYWKQRAMVCEG